MHLTYGRPLLNEQSYITELGELPPHMFLIIFYLRRGYDCDLRRFVDENLFKYHLSYETNVEENARIEATEMFQKMYCDRLQDMRYIK